MPTLGVAETLKFVRRFVPRGARILEIGCGDGELAAALGAVAIDSSPDAVAVARSRGVDARLATWPCSIDGTFDAVLFTRSLHHISPLDEAIARIPAPLVLIEDFSFADASPRVLAISREKEPAHDIHPFADIRRAVAAHFRIVAEEEAPYAYRYADDEDEARRLFEAELAIGEGMLGRRIVAIHQ